MSNHPDDIKARAEALHDEVEDAIITNIEEELCRRDIHQLEAMNEALMYVLGLGKKPNLDLP